MKKIILGLLTISLVSFLVYSCTKESVKEEVKNLKNVSQNVNETIDIQKAKVNWGTVVLADMGGAGLGFELGAKVAAFTGQVWCTGVGALTGAIGSSALAVKFPCHNCEPLGQKELEAFLATNAKSPSEIYRPNFDIKIDDIGYLHNQILYELYQDGSIIDDNGHISDIDKYLDFIGEQLKIRSSSSLLASNYSILYNPIFRKEFKDKFSTLYQKNSYTDYTLNIEFDNKDYCTSLISDFKNKVQGNSFLESSIIADEKIAIIQRENSLSVNDKKKLLAMFITYKNSFIFWKQFVKS